MNHKDTRPLGPGCILYTTSRQEPHSALPDALAIHTPAPPSDDANFGSSPPVRPAANGNHASVITPYAALDQRRRCLRGTLRPIERIIVGFASTPQTSHFLDVYRT